MPDSKSKIKWDRENVRPILLKLFVRTESDIISFLEKNAINGKTKQAIIKDAMRYYMAHGKDGDA